MNTMDIHKILEYLPHRYPFLMVDRVLSCEAGKNIVALKNVLLADFTPCTQEITPRHIAMRVHELGKLLRLCLQIAQERLCERAHR